MGAVFTLRTTAKHPSVEGPLLRVALPCFFIATG